jgi:steroid 5-alpha reductase family enzyme
LSAWSVITFAAVGLALTLSLAWAVQRRTGNSGWIDTFWTFSTGVAGVFMALAPRTGSVGPDGRQILVASFIAIWSLRLGWHILQRTRVSSDDPRYRDMIDKWGADAASKLFWHLQVQAAVGLLLATCAMLAARNPLPVFQPMDFLAISLFGAGIVGEAVADRQLRRFKQQKSGEVCAQGLWQYCRHPNYFCEWLCWLALPCAAIAFDGSYFIGMFAVAAPLCIYWLLVYVSGIPPLEAHMARSRSAAFRQYQNITPAFFPRFFSVRPQNEL